MILNICISFSASLKTCFYKLKNSKIIFFDLNLHFSPKNAKPHQEQAPQIQFKSKESILSVGEKTQASFSIQSFASLLFELVTEYFNKLSS